MGDGDPRTDMIEWFRQRDQETAEKAVAAARAEIVEAIAAWLDFQASKMGMSSDERFRSAAAVLAAAIRSGAFDIWLKQRGWAAEREGQGDG